ncbi:MAG: UPF0175 family protein [Acidobacteriaceae bacterium]
MQVTLEIPDTFAASLTAAGKDPARTALEALALEGYRSGQFSESVVRRLLGFDTRLEVHAFLADHDVPLNYSLEDWQHDKQVAHQNATRAEHLASR